MGSIQAQIPDFLVGLGLLLPQRDANSQYVTAADPLNLEDL